MSSNHVPPGSTGTAQDVPHSCFTPNEPKSKAITAQCPTVSNAISVQVHGIRRRLQVYLGTTAQKIVRIY